MSFCSSDSSDRKGLTHFFSFRFLGECCCQYPWRTSLVVNVFLFFMMLLFPIGYGVNDDVQIEWLIFNDDSPWGMCYFIHPLLSFIVKQLSIFFPSIAWYSWMMYGTVFVSFSIILGVVLRFINQMQETPDKIKNGLYFVCIGGLAYFIVDAYLYMQWTQTALAVLLAGLLLMIKSQLLKSQLKKLLWVMGGLFLFSLGCMIRQDVIYIVAPFICFYVIDSIVKWMGLKNKNWNKIIYTFLHYLSIAVLCIVSLVTLTVVKSNILKSSIEWGDKVEEKIVIQSNIVDYSDISGLAKNYSISGFSDEEINMMKTNFWFSSYDKTIEKMREYNNIVLDGKPLIHGIQIHLLKKMSMISKWIVPVAFLYIFFIFFTKNKRLLSTTIALISILALYLYIGRVTGRVLYGTYLSAFVFLIISQKSLMEIARSTRTIFIYRMSLIATLVIETIAGWHIAKVWNIRNAVDTTVDEYEYFVRQKDNFYVCMDVPSIFPRNPFLHTEEVLGVERGKLNSQTIVGWMHYTPTYEEVLNQGEHAPGIDLYQKLVTQDNFYVVTYKVSDESEFPLTIVLNYISKKMNVPVIAERCQDTESHTIWKLKQDGSSKVRE